MLEGRNLALAVALLMSAVACIGGGPDLACRTRPFRTDSGVSIRDLTCGRGSPVRRGDVVTVSYRGRLQDGAGVEVSRRPFTFPLGRGQVIPGWDEGLVGMRVGGVRRLVIPPAMAYGEAGYLRLIPPHATLVFRVRLLSVRVRS